MCTLSWLLDDDAYELHFNRDESRARRPAAPPSVQRHEGVLYVAPTDGDHGGTWIVSNEFGVAACLLNAYTEEPRPARAGAISRGVLVRALAPATSSDDLLERVEKHELCSFRPFLLVVFEPGGQPAVTHWDGRRLITSALDDRRPPLCSSSFDQRGVQERRRALLRRMVAECGQLDAGVLGAFHRSHEPARGPYSPCMHREEAATVSYSRLFVDGSSVRLSYASGAPCRVELGKPTEIPRALRWRSG